MSPNIKQNGSILLTLLVIIGVIMATSAIFTSQSVLIARSSFSQSNSDQAHWIAQSLLADAIQNYMRYGEDMVNPYPDWTTNCLQEENWLCKMELSLGVGGGTIDVWGQYYSQIKHLEANVVNDDGRIKIDSIQEVND